jgi:hypothetical protein
MLGLLCFGMQPTVVAYFTLLALKASISYLLVPFPFLSDE